MGVPTFHGVSFPRILFLPQFNVSTAKALYKHSLQNVFCGSKHDHLFMTIAIVLPLKCKNVKSHVTTSDFYKST